MKKKLLGVLVVLGGLCPAIGQETVFNFRTELGPGWSWIREHPQFWRVGDHGLEVRIEPGNMWGPQNDAKNVLVRSAPDFSTNLVAVSAKVENNPSNQYEQVDLVCYYNDSNMVKLGEELVDGKLSIVMGREQADKTRTIAIIPLDSTSVQLQLVLKGDQVRGRFRASDKNPWREAGQCDLPAPQGINPNLSLQFYQGTAETEHWARVSEFRISAKSD